MQKIAIYIATLLSICIQGLYGQSTESLEKLKCCIKPITPFSSRLIHRKKPHWHHIQADKLRIPITAGTSSNWSGYALATSLSKPLKDSVQQVSGSWQVPTISSANKDTYCAIWVGIDGYTSGTVEQIGTGHDWVEGSADHYAWFEMYPESAYLISNFPVSPHDIISAEVKYVKKNTFKLSIRNHTQKVYVVIPSSYTKSSTAKKSSAEWIVEAPSLDGEVSPLSQFSPVTFTRCTTVIRGRSSPINGPKLKYDALTIKTSEGTVKAQPSALQAKGSQFSVSWNHE